MDRLEYTFIRHQWSRRDRYLEQSRSTREHVLKLSCSELE
jgi:hypothetical protein